MGSDFGGGTWGFEIAVAHGRDLEISTIVECAVVVVGGVHRQRVVLKIMGSALISHVLSGDRIPLSWHGEL